MERCMRLLYIRDQMGCLRSCREEALLHCISSRLPDGSLADERETTAANVPDGYHERAIDDHGEMGRVREPVHPYHKNNLRYRATRSRPGTVWKFSTSSGRVGA